MSNSHLHKKQQSPDTIQEEAEELEKSAEDKEFEKELANVQRAAKLGEGAYGIVFKGINNSAGLAEQKSNLVRELPAVVAVKVVQMANLAGGKKTKRAILAKLRKECQLLCKLDQHPNIVKYYGFLEDKIKNEASIFMEFMPAGTLQSMYRDYGPLDESFVKRVTR